MKYYNPKTKKLAGNKSIDKFMFKLMALCKKHKMTVIPVKGELTISPYNSVTVKKMVTKVVDATKIDEKEEESEEESEETLESK